jgi:class 3 adenylate cyclase
MMTGPHPDRSMPPSQRRLAAILAADIRGYSRLMGADEEGTVARVTEQLRELADPLVRQHNGRIFKTMGDGFLAVFDSPLQAVRCALAFQKAVAERNIGWPSAQWLQYRIGINLGDVIAASDDLYGDSVNIAARLQTLAEPGGLCISGSVHDQVKRKLSVAFRSAGEERLKNIADPMRVFTLSSAAMPLRRTRWAGALSAALLSLFALTVVATSWWTWRDVLPRQQVGANQAPEAGAAAAPAMSPSLTLPMPSSAAEEHREAVFQRMLAVMSNNRFSWRTVERVALEAGVSEPEAHDILAAHPQEVTLGKSKEGKVIVRLADH